MRRSKGSVIGTNTLLPGAMNPPAILQMLSTDLTDAGLWIIENPSATSTQHAIDVVDGATTVLAIPFVNGPQYVGQRVGSAEVGNPYYGAMLDGTQNPPCLTFGDVISLSCGCSHGSTNITNGSNFPGVTNAQGVIGPGLQLGVFVMSGAGTGTATLSATYQGSNATETFGFVVPGWNLWSGTGAPSTSTVGVCNVGDWYLRRDAPLVGANTGLISVTDNLLPLNTLTTLTLQGATTNWGTNNIGTVTDSLGAVQPMSWTGLGANTLTGFSCAASTNAATGGAVTGAPQRIYMCTVASSGLGNAGTWVAFA